MVRMEPVPPLIDARHEPCNGKPSDATNYPHFYCRAERDREMVKGIHAKLDLMIENQKNAKR
jgi:hypothetical protein